MSDYLQQLEKLGSLHANGVLSDSEFENEKARILAARGYSEGETLVANIPWWRSKLPALLVGLVAILGIGGYFGAHAIERNQAESAKSPNEAGKPVRGLSNDPGIFALERDCTPNDALATVVRRIREAGLSTNSSDRVIQLSSGRSADVSQSNQKAGEIQVQTAAATVEVDLHGLKLTTVTTLDWPNGEGIRLTFSNPPDLVKNTLSRTGLLFAASEASEQEAEFITPLASGAALTCLKSTQSIIPLPPAEKEQVQ